MEPWQLCSRLLHKICLRPGLRNRAHIFQVTRREASHVGKSGLQVACKPVDDTRTPPLLLLPLEDIATDLPVESYQFPVHACGRALTCSLHPLLQLRCRLPIAGWVASRSYGSGGNAVMDGPGIIPVEETPDNFTRNHLARHAIARCNTHIRRIQRRRVARLPVRAGLQQLCAATCCTIAWHSLN